MATSHRHQKNYERESDLICRNGLERLEGTERFAPFGRGKHRAWCAVGGSGSCSRSEAIRVAFFGNAVCCNGITAQFKVNQKQGHFLK